LRFDKCKAINGDGGGLHGNIYGAGTLTMAGINSFTNCEASGTAGGYYIWTPNPSYDISIDGEI
jgi:hypothetical protein